MTPPATRRRRAIVSLGSNVGPARWVPWAQARLLSTIDDQGEARISDLAELDHCSQPTMTTQVRRLDPGVDTALLTYDDDPERSLSACVDAGHVAVHPWDRKVDERFVAAAHAVGLKVNVWTVDEPERIAELARWGVDGIVTNVPDVALATLGRS